MINKLIEEIRLLSMEKLLERIEARKAELFALKFQTAINSLEKTHRIKEVKKEISRIKFILSEKFKAGEKVNKIVKINYSQVVANAEKEGKKVRAKKQKVIKELHEQYNDNNTNDNAIADSISNVVVKKPKNVNKGEVE